MKQTDSIFTKIIKREIPASFVYEDKICIAIVDKFPEVEGKTLVIPKKQISYIFDLDDKTYQHILSVAKNISKALDEAFDTERTCLFVEGFEVPHVHIKLYPVKEKEMQVHGGLEISDKEAEKIAEKIKSFL